LFCQGQGRKERERAKEDEQSVMRRDSKELKGLLFSKVLFFQSRRR